MAIYRMPGNDVQTDSGWCAFMVAPNADLLAMALADGWSLTSPQAAEKAAALESSPEPDASPAEADDAGHTVESVRAQLDAAGITYKRSFGLARLLTLLPA